MFLASNICWVSSGTVSARYCWEPWEVSGAKPHMKKCRRGSAKPSQLPAAGHAESSEQQR
eukprot:COSAG01_NODE_40851_length_458_cov_191.306407_2_plen_59_part_01